MLDRELWLAVAAKIMGSIVPHIASPGKDQNSELEVWFPLNVNHFHTNVELKNCKLNHDKPGTIVLSIFSLVCLLTLASGP